ncbi:MAG: hypothetical protein DRO95_03435 [Candidatus Altiarchaeales archaeon]|nr:MAG: hypothetical protein DRO95_03435 [Candidatus Altiarchaeales archaeon]
MVIKCDVLVVGAGPAGSSAARAAAMRGAKTIFIDKKKEVGVPVQCAEGIGKYLFPYLPFKIPKRQLKWRIDGITFWVEEITIERKGEIWDGYTIDRDKFDKWLANLAIQVGAELRTSYELIDLEFDEEKNVKKAIIKTPKKTIEIAPRVLIAADGADSTVLKLLGLYNPKNGDIAEVYSWEMKNLDLKNPHMEQIYLGDFTPGGYAYIFPKSKKVANVGIGGLMREKELEKHFHEFLELEPVKKQLRNGEYVIEKTKNAVWGDLVDEWIYGNVLLAGDVANHNLKPFVEGILPAIVSGNLAGELGARMHNGEAIKMVHYIKSIEKKLHPHFRVSRDMMDKIHGWFSSRHRGRDLLFVGTAAGLFELERLDELEELGYEALKSELIDAKNET